MSIACRVCTASTDANLCQSCTAELEQTLAELPALLRELQLTATRQDRGTGVGLYAMQRRKLQIPGLHYAEGMITLPATPWPLGWDAANLAWSAANTLTTWARHLADARGITGPAATRGFHVRRRELYVERNRMHTRLLRVFVPSPEQPIATVSAWLLTNLDAIRLDEAAAAIHDELTSDRLAILRAIDRQDPDIFAGRCDSPDVRVEAHGDLLVPVVSICGADLYADLGDKDVKCGACGAVYDLKVRKALMAESVDEQWARPHLIANALTTLDERVNPDTLRKWIERDAKLAERLRERGGDAPYPLVLQVGIDDDGHALYRVGDVRARIAAAREARPRVTA